jgi:hypothetical protein
MMATMISGHAEALLGGARELFASSTPPARHTPRRQERRRVSYHFGSATAPIHRLDDRGWKQLANARGRRAVIVLLADHLVDECLTSARPRSCGRGR